MQAIVIFLLLSIPFSWVLAVDSLTVVINEVAWMGRETSFNDERTIARKTTNIFGVFITTLLVPKNEVRRLSSDKV